MSARKERSDRRPRPASLRQTLGLVLTVWVFLFLMAILLRWLIGMGLAIDLAILIVGAAFTLAAVFDNVWRRLQ